MSDIGKIFLFGFEEPVISLERLKFFKAIKAKNFILFKRNLEKLNENVEILRNEFDDPLISIDGEGGIVRRISEFDEFMFSNMNIGSSFDPKYAEETYFKMGIILNKKGINMNLAPVVDVYLTEGNTIGIRSFGGFEDLVSEFSVSAIKGLHKAKVYSVAKHFIGYGGVKADPHTTIPTFNLDYPFLERAIKPFYAVKDIADFVMTAHIIIPFVDKLPVTFSMSAISILREFYKGPIITDDLEMGGAKILPLHEIPIKALSAGNDILSVCSSLELQKLMVKEVERSKLSIDKHLERIESVRKFDKQLNEQLILEDRKYVTVYKDKNFIGTKEFKLILFKDLSEHFEGSVSFPLDCSDSAIAEISNRISKDDFVVVSTYNAFNHKGQIELIRSLKEKVKKVCVIITGDPSDRHLFPFADCIVLTYSPLPMIVKKALEVIKGEYQALGRLPV